MDSPLAQLRDHVLRPLSLTREDVMALYANTGLSASLTHVLTRNAQALTALQAQSSNQSVARECNAQITINASPKTVSKVCVLQETIVTAARTPK